MVQHVSLQKVVEEQIVACSLQGEAGIHCE